jgi:hypothetical protein
MIPYWTSSFLCSMLALERSWIRVIVPAAIVGIEARITHAPAAVAVAIVRLQSGAGVASD